MSFILMTKEENGTHRLIQKSSEVKKKPSFLRNLKDWATQSDSSTPASSQASLREIIQPTSYEGICPSHASLNDEWLLGEIREIMTA